MLAPIVEHLEVTALVHLPPARVYEHLSDFTRYSNYSEYVDRVAVRGDGVGARFAIRLSWWQLEYTVRGRVTDVDPPNRIEWAVTDRIDAKGYWSIAAAPDRAPPDCETASLTTLHVAYDASSVGGGTIGLPPLVSVDWFVDRVRPVAEREASAVARRVVADVEGERRPVDLRIDRDPTPDGRGTGRGTRR